jgi:hypothetical protein
MVNPFHEPKNLDILKEAFPLIDVSVIDDTLRSAKGDVNQAFEMLLAISDPSQSASNGPPLPNRPTINSYTVNFTLIEFSIFLPSIFANVEIFLGVFKFTWCA